MTSWHLLLAALVIVTTRYAYCERSGRCPTLKDWGVCVGKGKGCVEDDDCTSQVEKCCQTACGTACVKPLYTGCEQLHMEAERRARALGPEGNDVLIPQCNAAGRFDEVQCDVNSPNCWCVDESGFEVAGTRAPARSLVNCANPKPCAGHTCRMLCPHGFALQSDGCPMCQCRDPCSGVKCPGSLSCQVEDVACAEKPCPPVPKCKKGRSLKNVCPAGEPLRVTDTNRPFLCGTTPGKPNCPPLFQCLVEGNNDYGVCCPASFKLQKPGKCPARDSRDRHCGQACQHDLECPSMQKCCSNDYCGKQCGQPQNVTVCLQQKMLAELLVMSEREGKGYVPQCSEANGQFEAKQCSRNGLVCWCVDRSGNKIGGSMGDGKKVKCQKASEAVSKGRSAGESTSCDNQMCAQLCEYGFKVDTDGCPTCECDDPCVGYTCEDGEECKAMKNEGCTDDFLCPMYPVCQAIPMVQSTINPCSVGVPLQDPFEDKTVICNDGEEASGTTCPKSHRCTYIGATGQAVCCPKPETVEPTKVGRCPFLTLDKCDEVTACMADDSCDGDKKCCFSGACGSVCADPIAMSSAEEPGVTLHAGDKTEESNPPTMCEYLRDFNDKMEGTQDGMGLALRAPTCHPNGSYVETQCTTVNGVKQCWCVDNFGTEIPQSRNMSGMDCIALREELECLDLTCRIGGCDYGFVLSSETRCPLCECRNVCDEVSCGPTEECQMVDVNCENEYCSPVPACLPRKVGQCPYLIPVTSGSCDYECKFDYSCNGTSKCCSNGCGTQCVEPVVLTACQHQRAILFHKASEKGIPANQLYVPACKESDGSYESVQCHPVTRQCWCVDEMGVELSGTRAPPDVQPSCQAPNECPLRKCSTNCEHGYKMDADGCRMCECRNPCEEISCRGEGESCRLVDVECVDKPCPPVPMCLPRRDNPCEAGHPLLSKATAEVVKCGPDEEQCPLSHKCHLSPVGEYAVCCPKPRDVCFEPSETGKCRMALKRWFFNSTSNKCENFMYGGCGGNQNNFDSEKTCSTVCPVLSQCERLREKNLKAAERYKKATFAPRCDPETGLWEAVQCLEQVGVCWCVTRDGQPVKGSLTRGEPPACNFRQARKRIDSGEPEFVLEDLLKEVAAWEQDGNEMPEEVFERTEQPALVAPPQMTTRCKALHEKMKQSNAAGLIVACDAEGRFSPTQCYPPKPQKPAECWCVDEAGNQLPNTTTFNRGSKICLPTPIEAVEVKLGFYGSFQQRAKLQIMDHITGLLNKLGAKVKNDIIAIDIFPDVTFVSFSIIGSNKVDVAYYLEEMVKSQLLTFNIASETGTEWTPAIADITQSRFSHRLVDNSKNEVKHSEHVIALEHREVVSESTVSLVTPYQTAIILLFVGSAFIICILVVVIVLYRKKMSASSADNLSQKIAGLDQRFANYSEPIYVVTVPPPPPPMATEKSEGLPIQEHGTFVPTSKENDYETLNDNLNNVLNRKSSNDSLLNAKKTDEL